MSNFKIYLNEDKAKVDEVIEAIKRNDGYCPCAMVKSSDTKCMCKEFREMGEGMCRCKLYKKVRKQ